MGKKDRKKPGRRNTAGLFKAFLFDSVILLCKFVINDFTHHLPECQT